MATRISAQLCVQFALAGRKAQCQQNRHWYLFSNTKIPFRKLHRPQNLKYRTCRVVTNCTCLRHPSLFVTYCCHTEFEVESHLFSVSPIQNLFAITLILNLCIVFQNAQTIFEKLALTSALCRNIYVCSAFFYFNIFFNISLKLVLYVHLVMQPWSVKLLIIFAYCSY